MMNPEMMKMASDMMSKMTPEQRAQMQQQAASMMQQPGMMEQAMNMMNNMSPEDMRRAQQMAANMPPEHVASQAGNFGGAGGSGAAGSGALPHYSAALQLKTEGNGLFGQRRYREAASKYESAIARLQGDFSQQSKELRISCQGNLAFCFLELGQHQQCVEQCNAVLAADGSNRKALYRRGQAQSALGKVDAAVEDLRRALLLSPENEKDVIREKLQEVEQKQRHASRGVVIEEVTEPAPAAYRGAAQGMPSQQQRQQGEERDGQIEDLPPPFPAAPASAPAPAPGPAAATAAAAPMGGMGGGFPAVDPQHVQRVAEMMKSNPAYLQTMAQQMSSMSPEQLAEALRQGGGAAAGITPEMAKTAAEAMKGMPAEQLRAMADQAIAATGGEGSGNAGSGFAMTPEMAAAAASSDPSEQMRAAAAAMKSNPEMLKSAARMMESMSPEQLEAMAASMPGGMPGMKIDPEQVRMAAKMMETMSPEDLERMADMARSMGGMPGAAGAAPGGSAAPAVGAGSAGPMPGMPAGFDPSNMPPEMMTDMRKKMGDPAMMKMMQNMLKSMDPEALSSMMSQGGMKITPEQAQKMKDTLGGMSDQQMEALARVTRYINVLIDAFQKAKAFVLSQGLMVVALLVLLLAVLLRWRGWI